MPARKINQSPFALTGVYNTPEESHEFESALERDFIYRADFNFQVVKFVVQPITIIFENNGINRRYTPDILLYYWNEPGSKERIKPELCEIKYRKDLRENWNELKPKFKAAKEFAANKNWNFKIITEKEIRTPYLDNAKFFIKYRKSNPKSSYFSKITSALTVLKVSTANKILDFITNNDEERAEAIHALWFAVANGFVGFNFNEKLTMESKIWKRR